MNARKQDLKKMPPQKPAKDQREHLLLMGLVELYLKLGKPIGSNTLKENGFGSLSSATIRNYFAKLETNGYLKQQHSSGGRVPTTLAYKAYSEDCLKQNGAKEEGLEFLTTVLQSETRQIVTYLQKAVESISEATHCAAFLSAPRFDQDFVNDIKLVGIDPTRSLCILVTDFGLIHTEIIYCEKKLSKFTIKRIESYLYSRLTNQAKPVLTPEEEMIGSRFYSEIMLRHIVNYNNFSSEDIYKTGFAKLLKYPDFNEASALAGGLAIFENPQSLKNLLTECQQKPGLTCLIGEDLHKIIPNASICSVIAIPYKINQTPVGALAILGPNRVPYKKLFGILQGVSDLISETLTKSLYKFKITHRMPKTEQIHYQPFSSIEPTKILSLEDQSLK
ncbi:MAG: heat-inducible transcriptional repressor HrcA [Rhabdochlamydiaceae bacterium]